MLPNLILQRTQLLPGKSPVSEYAKAQFKLFSEVGKCETFKLYHFPRGQTVRQKKSPIVTADEDKKIEKIKKRTAGKQNTRIYDHTVVTHHDHIYDIEVYGRRKLKKKRHSVFLQFDLIPHELCDSRHQLRAVEGFLVVALQDVGLVVVRLVVKKPSPMS